MIDSLEEMQYLVDNNSDYVEKAFEDKQLINLLQVRNLNLNTLFQLSYY